jgi:hypothetical protein
MGSETEVLGYGISLILLNVGMYIGGPVAAIVGIRRRGWNIVYHFSQME